MDRTDKLSIEQKSYQMNRKAIDRTEKNIYIHINKNRINPHFYRENAQLRNFCRENLSLRAYQ